MINYLWFSDCLASASSNLLMPLPCLASSILPRENGLTHITDKRSMKRLREMFANNQFVMPTTVRSYYSIQKDQQISLKTATLLTELQLSFALFCSHWLFVCVCIQCLTEVRSKHKTVEFNYFLTFHCFLCLLRSLIFFQWMPD